MGILHNILNTDIESRSRLDISVVGSSVYSRHPSTEVLVIRFALDDGEVQQWKPGDPVPAVFSDPNVRIVAAMSSGFELEMFENLLTPRHGFPRIPLSRWICVAGIAGHAGLRQSMTELSKVLDLGEYGKDNKGKLNMMRLCRPWKVKGQPAPETDEFGVWHGGEFDENPERHAINDAYCGQDVVAQREVFRILPTPPAFERRAWITHRKMCSRGLPIDLPLCHGAHKIMLAEVSVQTERFIKITGFAPTCRQQFQDWIASKGCPIGNMQEATVDDYIERGLGPQVVRDALQIKKRVSGATAKKYAALIASTDEDGRARNLLKYYGANTGRWSGMGAQPQNLKKSSRDDEELEPLFELLTRGDHKALIDHVGEDGVFDALGDCIRGSIKAPDGYTLTCSDFSGIEARITAYAAGCGSLLNIFRTGEDVYIGMAMKVLGCKLEDVVNPETMKADTPARKKARQMGKIPFLGCGYQMGWEKLQAQAAKANIAQLTEQEARNIVEIFRKEYPEVPAFWRDIENAANWCVQNNSTKPVGNAMFKFRMYKNWLTMQLPSGRALFFNNPRFEPSPRFKGQQQLVYDSPKGKKQLYGGLWTENWVQAFSRDLMVEALERCEDNFLETILTCHDEVVTLDRINCPSPLHDLMEIVPSWAEGAPVASETHQMVRYGK